MLLQLVKKDFLICRKYIFQIMLIPVIISLFIGFNIGDQSMTGIISIVYMVLMSQLMSLQTLSQVEEKAPRAAALLCASPYPRRSFVLSKYIFSICIFAYNLLIHTMIMAVWQPSQVLGPMPMLAMLLLSMAISGIYLPIDFKFGAIKSRYIFFALIAGFTFFPVLHSQFMPSFSIDLSWLQSLPDVTTSIVLVVASAALFLLSSRISIHAFEAKDL